MFIVLNNDIFKTDQSSLNKIKHQNSQKQYKKSNPCSTVIARSKIKSMFMTKQLQYSSINSSRTSRKNPCLKKSDIEIDLKDNTLDKSHNISDEKDVFEENRLVEKYSNLNKSDSQVDTCYLIPQLDGMDDLSDVSDAVEEIKPSKTIFGIQCEHREIIQLMNFFRSFNVSWLSSVDHTLCWLDEECFFCNLRSMFLRLRQERIKGPYLLKLNEFICSISKYEEVLDYTLMNNLVEIEQNIEHTFKLIFQYRKSSPFFSISQIYCTNCSRGLDKYVLNVVLEECHRSKILTLDELLRLSIETLKKKKGCCQIR